MNFSSEGECGRCDRFVPEIRSDWVGREDLPLFLVEMQLCNAGDGTLRHIVQQVRADNTRAALGLTLYHMRAVFPGERMLLQGFSVRESNQSDEMI